jgi:signal transduction histidine kinase
MLVLLIHRLFPKLYHKLIAHCYLVLCGLFALSTFILDTKAYSAMLIGFQIPSVIFIIYTIIRFAMTLKDGGMKKLLGFLGVSLLCIFAINDLFYYRGVTFIGLFGGQIFTTPVGMLFFTFCYALIVSMEYAETERAMMEARENEHRLAGERAVLERLNMLKTDLMRTISHEMRTPLAVIMGFAEITAEDARRRGAGETLAGNLVAIAAEAGRMADMMEEMRQLALAKEYHKDRLPVDLSAVIYRIAGLYAKVLERSNTALEITVSDNLPLVPGSESELTQVIFNLVRNADTHTENGVVSIYSEFAEGFVKVTVSDTGAGIPPELLP